MLNQLLIKQITCRYTDADLSRSLPSLTLYNHISDPPVSPAAARQVRVSTQRLKGLKPAAPTFAPPRSTHMPQDKERGPGPTYAMPEIHTGNLSCQRAHESPGEGIVIF